MSSLGGPLNFMAAKYGLNTEPIVIRFYDNNNGSPTFANCGNN